MADFINTVDVLGDDAVIDSIIDRTITEFKDNAITKIGESAFRGCTELSEVAFPNVTEIGHFAFQNCTSLKAITPDTFPKVTNVPYSYQPNWFINSGLESVDWPSLVEYNDLELFYQCKSLVSANLPNLSTIGSGVCGHFGYCSALAEVNLPKLTLVANNMFRSCGVLKRLSFPSAATVVGTYSFAYCSALECIDLPVCTSIEGGFHIVGDGALVALVLRSETMCSLENANFFSEDGISTGNGHIYVPRALVDSYKAATNWSTVATKFRALEDYTVDGTITGELDETKI